MRRITVRACESKARSTSRIEIEPQLAEALLGMEVRHSESVLWRRGYWLIVMPWLHEANSESFREQGSDVLKGAF
jgi:hypothetical protein